MPIDRAAWRNVHFYDASTRTIVGGFYHVLLVVDGHWTVRHRESQRTVASTSNPAVPGNYDIYTEGTIQISDEAWYSRMISHAGSGREDTVFRDQVRARDRKCVISGEDDGISWGFWVGFEAGHIFSPQREELWMKYNYGRWITDTSSGSSPINSVQNGLLMSETIHTRFAQFLLSIDPDDGYKIITFVPGCGRLDGRILDPICRNLDDPDRVSDDVLRWHFRQSILANMRGAGEPIFESDFP